MWNHDVVQISRHWLAHPQQNFLRLSPWTLSHTSAPFTTWTSSSNAIYAVSVVAEEALCGQTALASSMADDLGYAAPAAADRLSGSAVFMVSVLPLNRPSYSLTAVCHRRWEPSWSYSIDIVHRSKHPPPTRPVVGSNHGRAQLDIPEIHATSPHCQRRWSLRDKTRSGRQVTETYYPLAESVMGEATSVRLIWPIFGQVPHYVLPGDHHLAIGQQHLVKGYLLRGRARMAPIQSSQNQLRSPVAPL